MLRKKSMALCAMGVMVSVMLMSSKCESAQSPAEKLIARINCAVEKGVILFGHQDDPVYGHTWKFEANRSDVLETAGDYPAIMGWDLGRIEFDSPKNLDGVPFDLMREEIQKQHARGGINTISWHAYTPDGKDSWIKDTGVVTTILPGGENYDIYQDHLAKAAKFLLSLRDEKGELIPIIFRPWHEHDGNWFWWGENRCTHEEYRALWNMTYEHMQAKGLNHLVWAYMPYEELTDKMPAPERFDMLGIDIYQRSEDPTQYITDIKAEIAHMKQVGEQYNKPIAITETGYEGIKTADWWTKVLYSVMENEPISYVLVWRNAWDRPEHFYGPFKGHSEEDDFVEFANKPSIVFAKEAGEICR